MKNKSGILQNKIFAHVDLFSKEIISPCTRTVVRESIGILGTKLFMNI